MSQSLVRLLAQLLLLVVDFGLACHPRYLSDVIVTHLEEEVPSSCQGQGQDCKYDRNCCANMECKMQIDGFRIVSRCEYRLVNEDYNEITVGPTWKDYQEIEWSEEDRIQAQNLKGLIRRNEEIRKNLMELQQLKMSVGHQQMLNQKRRLQEKEIEELRKEKNKYDEQLKIEMDRLKEKELQDKLESFEKKEVNLAFMKQQNISNLYMNMLNDLDNKESLISKKVG